MIAIIAINGWAPQSYKMNRCIGCQWRTPQRFGGQGIICSQKDGKCPDWAVTWALRYSRNGSDEPRKSFVTDEDLLEALRL